MKRRTCRWWAGGLIGALGACGGGGEVSPRGADKPERPAGAAGAAARPPGDGGEGGAAGGAAAGAGSAATAPGGGEAVRALYLVPSDRAERAEYRAAIGATLGDVRRWLYDALGVGKTFALADPAVEVVRTDHPADWYARPADGAAAGDPLAFLENARADGLRLSSARDNDPRGRWLLFIDAEPACDQAFNVDGAGVAVLTLANLELARGAWNECPGQIAEPSTACAWAGLVATKVVGTLGLLIPPGCGPDAPDELYARLTCAGWISYPDEAGGRVFSDLERATLEASPFLFATEPPPPAAACENLRSARSDATSRGRRSP